MGPIVLAKNRRRKTFVRQLPAFHVLHFKYLLPDVEVVKLAMRSSWLVFTKKTKKRTGGSPDWTMNMATTFCQPEPHTDLV